VTSLRELRDEAAGCTRCDLHERATQTVFGEGPAQAAIALVGEQPGDQEDKQGHPFAGPAHPEIRACGHWLAAELEAVRRVWWYCSARWRGGLLGCERRRCPMSGRGYG